MSLTTRDFRGHIEVFGRRFDDYDVYSRIADRGKFVESALVTLNPDTDGLTVYLFRTVYDRDRAERALKRKHPHWMFRKMMLDEPMRVVRRK